MNDSVVQCSTWCSLWEMRGTTDGGCSGDIRPRPLLTLRLWSLVTILSPHQWEPVVSMRRNYFTLLGFLSLVLMSREEMFVTKTEVFTIVTILLSLIHFSFLTLSSPCFASVFQSKKNLCCCVVLFSENTKQEVSQLEAVQVDLTIVRENKKGITTAKTDLAAKKQFRYIWCKIFLVEILSSVGVVLRY